MMGPKISYDYFFDRAKVKDALERKEQRVLSGTGAFYRRAVQQSMRPGGKKNAVSQPGEPPRFHTKQLRVGIGFAYDPSARSVVVGVNKWNHKGNTPSVLNQGGDTILTELVRRGESFVKAQRRVRIEARPFIGPPTAAHEAGVDKFKQLLTQGGL